jgi:hypothetical protein
MKKMNKMKSIFSLLLLMLFFQIIFSRLLQDKNDKIENGSVYEQPSIIYETIDVEESLKKRILLYDIFL